MIISIHQPQYIPWISYFRKIEKSDLFIFLDTVDFQKNGLQNRNQIKTEQGRKWLTVPVQQHLGQKIRDVKIDTTNQWRRKHWESIHHSYGRTVEFAGYEKEFSEMFSKEWIDLTKLNVHSVELMLKLLEIKTPILRSSEMQAVGQSSELIINLCKEVGASSYLSGFGGKSYLDMAKFTAAGIEVIFQSPTFPNRYQQAFPHVEFLNDLSAIDILFNCGDQWRNYLPKGG